MLDEKAIDLINDILSKGKDVEIEIQHRKNGLAILEISKKVKYREKQTESASTE